MGLGENYRFLGSIFPPANEFEPVDSFGLLTCLFETAAQSLEILKSVLHFVVWIIRQVFTFAPVRPFPYVMSDGF